MFPDDATARDRFILARRPPRRVHDPWRSSGVDIEEERTSTGASALVATIFLTGRECSWRCTMCDLWQYTVERDTPAGAISAQIADAIRSFTAPGPVTQVKLYNAGSFFDPRAVPPADYHGIASSVARFDRVVVESHPALVGRRTTEWLAALGRASTTRVPPQTEVAMGLETVHPAALERLNKRMTVDDFRRAADRLAAMQCDVRVFVLVSPPFIPAREQDAWLVRSVEAAFACGAAVVSLIPMRDGNGSIEALAADGLFTAPRLADLERSIDLALSLPRPDGARVFADLWDLDRLATCPHCLERRRGRLRRINRSQQTAEAVSCLHCDGTHPA